MAYMSRGSVSPEEDDDWRGFRAETDLLTEDELLLSPGRSYLVPGFLPTRGMTVAYGPPKDGGKTSFWLRLARRLSQGLPLFGHPGDGEREVTYLATEGSSSLRDRVEALRQVDGRAARFRVITKPLNPFSTRDVEELACALDSSHLLVIDTLGRMMGSMGADENGSDMARLIGNFDLLRERTYVQLVVVHHPGLGSCRPRGNTSLSGAADVIIEHAMLGDGSRTATVKYARDDPPGKLLRYRLRPIGLPEQKDTPARKAVIAEEMDEPLPAPEPASAVHTRRGRRKAAV